jgi:poly(A) polymerase
MFTEGGGGGRALDLLDRTGLLAQVLPEVAALHGVEQPPEFHPEGDVFVHTSLMVAGLDAILGGGTDVPASDCVRVALEPDWGAEVLAWSVLLHDIGKPLTQTFSDRIRFHRHETVGAEMAAEVLTRLRRPRRVRDTVSEVIGAHMRFAQLPRMRRARQRRLTRDPAFVHHLILHWLDCCSSHRRLRVYEYGLSCWQRERERPAPLERLIGGSELIAMGMAPGPAMGRLLRELEDAQLEGEVNTREEALAWAASRLGPDTESPAPE